MRGKGYEESMKEVGVREVKRNEVKQVNNPEEVKGVVSKVKAKRAEKVAEKAEKAVR